jgi:hypothetical protein
MVDNSQISAKRGTTSYLKHVDGVMVGVLASSVVVKPKTIYNWHFLHVYPLTVVSVS